MTRPETSRRPVAIAFSIVVVALLGALLLCWSTLRSNGEDDERHVSGLNTTATTPSHGDAAGAEDGVLPEGASLNDDLPGITNLDADLLDALRAAERDANAEGITFVVNTGWRSAEYQQMLIDDAIATYGSRQEASRWVATVTGSAHVNGEAVDIGGYDAVEWLQEHGAAYDLCQTFDNEAWHFELRPGASTQGCPRPYYDASDDPRNQSS